MRIFQGRVTETSSHRSTTGGYYVTTFVLDQKTKVSMQPNQPLAIRHNDHIIVGGFFLGRRFMAMAYHNSSTGEKWQNSPLMMGGLGLFLLGLSLYALFSSLGGNNLVGNLLIIIPIALAGMGFLWYARAIYKTFQKVASFNTAASTPNVADKRK